MVKGKARPPLQTPRTHPSLCVAEAASVTVAPCRMQGWQMRASAADARPASLGAAALPHFRKQ